MSMARFSPSTTMKTVWLALVATVAATLLALGMNSSPAQANPQPHSFHCNAVVSLVMICDNNVDTTITVGGIANGNDIDVGGIANDLTVIDGDLTVSKVANVLSGNNVHCATIVIAVLLKPDLRGVCNGS